MTTAPAARGKTPSASTAPSTDSPTPSSTDAGQDPDASRVPRFVIGIDSAVEQGNRVTLTTPNFETDPIGDLKARIVEHFDDASVVVKEIRALADELETLLNKVKTGL